MTKKSTYEDAGVSIDAGNEFVNLIKPFVKKTENRQVIGNLGHFAGLFRPDFSGYQKPVLVASTDGVGTKLKLGIDMDQLEGLGQDLVAMSANDLACMGATPLFFLDYYATSRLEVPQAVRVVQGIADACKKIGAVLLGGETAEMPGIYQQGDFDLAGFLVGVIDEEKIIDGSDVKEGDQIIGFDSRGLQSNGFSLVRKIIRDRGLNLQEQYSGLKKKLGTLLLEPTPLYSPIVGALLKTGPIHGMAHITGGGLLENIPRCIPGHLMATVRKNAWPLPDIFRFLQEQGNLDETEMHRVFNCGVGYVCVVPREHADAMLKKTRQIHHDAWLIGEITQRTGDKGILIS